MLKLVPVGLDAGNGWIKICIDGKVSKIPNYSTEKMPRGALTKRNVHKKAMAFEISINGKNRYFGQDTLSLSGKQEIDEDKYKSEYLNMMFQAALYRWITQHNISSDFFKDKRMNIVAGMPPEQFQDARVQNSAFKAFSGAFNNKRPQYLKTPDLGSIPFFTAFKAIKPETLSWRVNGLKPGYTLLVDLGYGTSDLCLLNSNDDLPDITKSLNNGLMHTHDEANSTESWLSELEAMRTKKVSDTYGDVTKVKIRKLVRRLAGRNIKLTNIIVFGGGINLLDNSIIADIKRYGDEFSKGDEFTNVRCFAKLAALNE